MAVRNQSSPFPGYRDDRYPQAPQRERGPRATQAAGDTLILTLLFIVAPICGLLGLLISAFLWVFIVVTVMTLLAMWAVGCFEPRRRSFLSGMLIVCLVLALARGLTAGNAPTRSGDLFPVYGGGSNAADLQAQTALMNTMDAADYLGTGVPQSQAQTEQPAATATPPLRAVMTIAPAVLPAQTSPPAQSTAAGQQETLGAEQPNAGGQQNAALPATGAEQVLGEYLQMWRAKDFEGMSQLTTQTWRKALKTPANMQLSYDLSHWELRNWTITTQSTAYEDVVVLSVYAELVKATSDRKEATCTYNISVYNEGGEWRVDPDSMREKPVPVELQANAGGGVAAGAGTSSSPAPDPTVKPTTKLWYNPDGGEYYHAEQKCTKINEKYYSKMKSFEYSELEKDSKLKKLNACAECNAPK